MTHKTIISWIAFSLLITIFSNLAKANVPSTAARPNYENASGNLEGGGVILYDGIINPNTSGVDAAPNSNGIFLSEATWGHPVALNQSFGPAGDFVLRKSDNSGVYDVLYPDGYRSTEGVNLTRNDMEDAELGGVFRYKWLLYSDESGNSPVLNIFEQSFQNIDDDENPWFNDSDRLAASEQIEVLREALASAPINQELQIALLNTYYDLATAEIQFARKRQAKLSTVRLGLQTANNPFIIDDEIQLYRELIQVTGQAIAWYADLFSTTMEGVEPGDFDSNFRGVTFGRYIFTHRVPGRRQTEDELQYAADEGILNTVDPNANLVFSGFKDYRSLITIHGQYMQFKTDLARLLAIRRNTSDVTEARGLLSEVQGPDVTTFIFFQGLFPSVNFDSPALDSTGVRQAYSLVSTAINTASNLRGFVDGTSNVLGLDPNFLLLVPTKPNEDKFDTYDILSEKLTEQSGDVPVGPLAVALDKLGDPDNPDTGGGAIQSYATFRETATQTATELDKLNDDFAERFLQITGYDWNEGDNDWDGIRAHPTNPSELATVERLLNSLNNQNETLNNLLTQLLQDTVDANEAVSIAEGIESAITDAETTYINTTSPIWEGIANSSATMAAIQAMTDGVYTATGVDGLTTTTTGGYNLGAIAAMSVANAAAQASYTRDLTKREKEIDNAAISFESKLAAVELPLTVQQSKMEVGALQREFYALLLELEDNNTAMAQTVADKTSLIREVERHEDYLDDDRNLLANSYHADPIHYLRAESSILKANAAFRRAQRWVFFTARALEYKGQERFNYRDPLSGEDFDIGTIFKARNATELENIFQKMAFFNQDREASPGSVRDDRVTISMRDNILTPNPDDLNLEFGAFPPDNGRRWDSIRNRNVSKQRRFRDILREKQTASGPGGGINGPIKIEFNTLLEIGQFFAGPDYSDINNIKSGLYRDKIEWVAVHFVFADGSSANGNAVPTIPGNNGIEGSMTYSGNTFFRTRVPPAPDRSPGATAPGTNTIPSVNNAGEVQNINDFPGEFVVAPFRYYQDTNFTGVFDLFDRQVAPSLEFLFSTQSAEIPEVENKILDATEFQIPDFKERSVATTRWILEIDGNQFRISDLIDIEIIIQHRAYVRPQITAP